MPSPVPPLNISLRASRRLQYFWLFIYGITLLVLLLLPMAWFYRLGLLAGWLILAVMTIAECRRLRGVSSLHIHDERLRLVAAGESLSVELSGAPLVTFPLLVLPLRSRSRRWQLLLLSDSADADDLRRLRVWLRWRAERSSGATII